MVYTQMESTRHQWSSTSPFGHISLFYFFLHSDQWWITHGFLWVWIDQMIVLNFLKIFKKKFMQIGKELTKLGLCKVWETCDLKINHRSLKLCRALAQWVLYQFAWTLLKNLQKIQGNYLIYSNPSKSLDYPLSITISTFLHFISELYTYG